MSKRFTETEIWNEDWYLDMDAEYRLFWNYIKDTCNHAGVWKPNVRRFNADIENKIDLDTALHRFNDDKTRVDVLPSGHWVILDFVRFQYGSVLNLNNSCHLSVFNKLKEVRSIIGFNLQLLE